MCARTKEKLLEFISEMREIDKVLLLFTFFNGMLLRLVLSSDADVIQKVSACCTLLALVFLSAIANEALKETKEARYFY